MKSKLTGFLFLSSIFLTRQLFAADQPVYIYLIDPEDKATIKAFDEEPETDDASTNAPAEPQKPAPKSTTGKPKRTIDDILGDLDQKAPTTKEQERIIKMVVADQMKFMQLLDQFTKAPFDPEDDEAKPEFNQIRGQIVKILFDSPDEKFFYERLFLINKIWLENSTEVIRFSSLDKALRDRSLELEERSRRYRQIVIAAVAAGGAVAGGYLSFKISEKFLPVVANEKGMSQIVRWAGRGTMVFVGAGAGAWAGAMAGFLGSEHLVRRRNYIDPIDTNNQDLRELLKLIEKL